MLRTYSGVCTWGQLLAVLVGPQRMLGLTTYKASVLSTIYTITLAPHFHVLTSNVLNPTENEVSLASREFFIN